MRNLRPLLRLDDKVAAEGRRLEFIGGPPMTWVAPVALLTAVLLHGLALLLPVLHVPTTFPSQSLAADLPLVWRPEAAAPVQKSPVAPARRRSVIATATEPASKPPEPAAPRAFSVEPVPEPAPDVALVALAAHIEAIIPGPDEPPPSLEIGPPEGSVPDAAPSPVRHQPPAYPSAALRLSAEGRVTVRLLVLPDGSVGDAVIEECSRPGLGFEAAALAAVKRWRYEPAPLQAGSRTLRATIHFQQQERRP